MVNPLDAILIVSALAIFITALPIINTSLQTSEGTALENASVITKIVINIMDSFIVPILLIILAFALVARKGGGGNA